MFHQIISFTFNNLKLFEFSMEMMKDNNIYNESLNHVTCINTK